MKSFSLILPALICAFVSVGHAEDTKKWPTVVMPAGEIPSGARIKVEALPEGESVVSTPNAHRPLGTTANSQMMKVTEVEAPQLPAADQADLTTQAQQGTLRVSNSDLTTAACTTSAEGIQSCQTQTPTPISIISPTNPNFVYPALAAPTAVAPAITTTAATNGDSSGMMSLLASVASALGQSNSVGSVGSSSSSSEICDTGSGSAANTVSMISRSRSGGGGPLPGSDPGTIPELAASLDGKGPPVCAIKQARDALLKGRSEGKVTNDVMIINDFSSGAAKGRMYFVNSNGTLADVGVPNPIEVARGDGGFGSSGGSGKTPNGALYTSAVHWRGNANVKDGIELNGLEDENRNTVGRGVLLHGWNPNSVTHGCLGIPGTLTTGRGVGHFGNYLDRLKGGLLKSGGVMIYNFTPKKASGC